MQSISMLLVLFALASGTFAASGVVHRHHLRSGPPPAPAPMASPGPAPELLTPEEAVEEAHHTTAAARGEYIVDKAGRELDKADVASAKAAKFMAEKSGDKDSVKEAKEKVSDQQAQVKKSAEETQESKDAFKAAKSAYQHAEVAADNAETSNAKKASAKEGVVKLLREVEDAVKAAYSFVQIESKVAKKGPSNQNFDDLIYVGKTQEETLEEVPLQGEESPEEAEAGEPKKGDGFFAENPNNDEETPNDDANMVSDDDGNDDDSFVQVASKKAAKKSDGSDGFGTPDPLNQNFDDIIYVGKTPEATLEVVPMQDEESPEETEAGEPKKGNGVFERLSENPRLRKRIEEENPNNDEETANDDANMVSADDGGDDDSFAQVASKKAAKKGDGFDGYGTPDPSNQNVDDIIYVGKTPEETMEEVPLQGEETEAGEPKKGDGFFEENPNNDAENPDDDANMVSDDDSDDDDSFLQVASRKVAKKGDGFDGFGTPDPFNQNDDDQVDAGEPNAPDAENPNDDANMVSDDDDSEDDSFMQVASKQFLVKMNQIKKQFLSKAVGPH